MIINMVKDYKNFQMAVIIKDSIQMGDHKVLEDIHGLMESIIKGNG
jgi:hypothetical protein